VKIPAKTKKANKQECEKILKEKGGIDETLDQNAKVDIKFYNSKHKYGVEDV
jgi:hypothetical protein